MSVPTGDDNVQELSGAVWGLRCIKVGCVTCGLREFDCMLRILISHGALMIDIMFRFIF